MSKKWQTVEEAFLWLKKQGARVDRKNPFVLTVEVKGLRTFSALDYLRSQKVNWNIQEAGKASVILTPAYSQLLQGPSPTRR